LWNNNPYKERITERIMCLPTISQSPQGQTGYDEQGNDPTIEATTNGTIPTREGWQDEETGIVYAYKGSQVRKEALVPKRHRRIRDEFEEKSSLGELIVGYSVLIPALIVYNIGERILKAPRRLMQRVADSLVGMVLCEDND
jgi:hypothetical protein